LVKYQLMGQREIDTCLSKSVALGVLHDCLEDGSIIQSKHFRSELAHEKLTFEDAWHVLRTGQIYDNGEPDIKTGEWKYRVEGYENGGKWIAIIFSFKAIDMALLITIFSVENKGRHAR